MAKLEAFLVIFCMIAGFQPVVKCEEEKSLLGSLVKYGGFAADAVENGMEVYETVKELYGKLQPKTTKESESDDKQDPGMEQRITDQVKKVSKQISSLKVNVENMKSEIIDKILTELPEEMSLRDNLFQIYLRINQIENLFQNFGDYVVNPRNFSIGTLEDFAVHATSHDLNELPNVLKTMHWMLVQSDTDSGESIVTMLSKNTQSPAKMCKRQQSLQQMLYMLYDSIVRADIKGHTMIQYAFMLLGTIKKESKTGEIEQARQQFITRISNTRRSVKKAMSSASRLVWKCDTDGYKENVTYTRFDNLVQKYIVNEVDLNAEGTCTATCPEYNHRVKVHSCYNKKICKKQRTCKGELWDCEHKISGKMWICPSEKNSNRRYEYIEYGNSQRYGLKGTCKNPATEIKSWTRGTVQCTYCTCTCDDVNDSKSDRYVNVRNVYSDYHQKYVVTGVRLRKVNHILHLQIQQGKLLPGGLIDESTVQWKKIDDYKINGTLSSTVGTDHQYIPREDHDYAILKHKDGRHLHKDDKVIIRRAAFNLDDLDFADEKKNTNHVVVGVRFSICLIKGSGEHINLETMMMPFNFTTGQIDYKEQLYSNCRSREGQHKKIYKSDKVEVKLEELNIPTEGAAAVPTSQTNQFLYLKTSSMETDAGQNTLPFLDIQDVETYPHVPLSGVGLFHKSSPGTGGFLSLKLFTYNYEPSLDA